MVVRSLAQAFTANFLGQSPTWYKWAIAGFLVINPIALATVGPFVTGWMLVFEFIFTLAMALQCYPLQPGGLLALEAILLQMTSPAAVYQETAVNFPVVLLLIFMVAGIFFLQELLLFTFTKLLLMVRSKPALALVFCGMAALLSAFLDALTVIAIVITVAEGFYAVYHRVTSGRHFRDSHDHTDDGGVPELSRDDLDRFRAFLRSLMMHAAVGTTLGGVATLVGEPQNLLIAKTVGWEFVEFFTRMAPVSFPVLAVGLLTCYLLEKTASFGFGEPIPEHVLRILIEFDATATADRTSQDSARLFVQAGVVLLLVVALGLHLAEVGIIGLTVIVVATALTGVTEEHRLGHAFTAAMPFTALLVVFFGIVAVIHDQHLFAPVMHAVLGLEGRTQIAAFYLANGLLSAVSDNVFVATVYISEVFTAFEDGLISRAQLDLLAVAINTGTNIPSVATPNGQAAFLFLLTSALAPLIRLSYGRMVVMALPYAVTMTITGLASVIWLL